MSVHTYVGKWIHVFVHTFCIAQYLFFDSVFICFVLVFNYCDFHIKLIPRCPTGGTWNDKLER